VFENKTLLITGGTGPLAIRRFEALHQRALQEVRIFSRDEKEAGNQPGGIMSRASSTTWETSAITGRFSMPLAAVDSFSTPRA